VPTAVAEILAEANRLLESERFDDYCVNGLQVPGPERVSLIATGVSAHSQLFALAAHAQAELLIVHHGLFWGSGVRVVEPALKRRLQLLFDANIALAGYHLPLDAHPELGNNALLASLLGATDPKPFALHKGQPIGFIAHFPGQGLPVHDLISRAHAVTEHEPLVFDAGPPLVRRLAIVSGGGTDFIADAVAAGADAFLTGEPTERAMAMAREGSIHYIAAGHHATETFGVRRLGEHLAERFGLRHVFLDVPNPV
jgi:dinuclear metal center YbgI/SA1388 family protein